MAPPSPERPASTGVVLAPATAAELLRAAAAVSPAALAPVLAAGVPVNVADESGMTALHLAAKCGSPVGPLIAAGGDVNAKRVGDAATPLHLACGFGNVAGSRALLAAGADANAACKQGSRPLHWAARSSPGCVRALLEAGADPSQLCNDGSVGGWTALMLSAGSGQAKSVALLLGAGAAVDAARGDGVTALMLAAGCGSEECVGHLLASGASPFRRDLRGDSALHHGARAGSEACVQALLDAGADPSSANRAGETAQQVASGAGAPGAAMLLWEAAAQAAAAAEAAAKAAAAAAALELERQRAEEASKPTIMLTRVQSAPILGLVRRALSAVPEDSPMEDSDLDDSAQEMDIGPIARAQVRRALKSIAMKQQKLQLTAEAQAQRSSHSFS